MKVEIRLSELCQALAGAVEQAIEEDKLEKVRRKWTPARNALGSGGRREETRTEIRNDWSASYLRGLREITQKELNDQFELVAGGLAARFKMERASARGHIRYLLDIVGRRTADGMDREEIPALIKRFLEELGGAGCQWEGRIWLRNLKIECDDLPIDETFTLRKPRSEDFNWEAPTESVAFRPQRQPFSEPDSILEVQTISAHEPSDLVRRFVNCLCLFRAGNIAVQERNLKADSLLSGHGGRSTSFQTPQERFQYSLSEVDCKPLAEFRQRLNNILPLDPTGHHSNRDWIGLKFYFRALKDATDDEERVAQAVASLEAVLCAEERGGLARTLRQRTAALLQFAGMNPGKVAATMQRAYKIRSAFAHGDQVKNLEDKLPADCNTVLNYARLVVLKDLELRLLGKGQPWNRKKLGGLLDDSLLDSGRRKELGNRVRGGLWNLAVPAVRSA